MEPLIILTSSTSNNSLNCQTPLVPLTNCLNTLAGSNMDLVNHLANLASIAATSAHKRWALEQMLVLVHLLRALTAKTLADTELRAPWVRLVALIASVQLRVATSEAKVLVKV